MAAFSAGLKASGFATALVFDVAAVFCTGFVADVVTDFNAGFATAWAATLTTAFSGAFATALASPCASALAAAVDFVATGFTVVYCIAAVAAVLEADFGVPLAAAVAADFTVAGGGFTGTGFAIALVANNAC